MIYKNANPYRCHFNISLIYHSNMLRKLGPGQVKTKKKDFYIPRRPFSSPNLHNTTKKQQQRQTGARRRRLRRRLPPRPGHRRKGPERGRLRPAARPLLARAAGTPPFFQLPDGQGQGSSCIVNSPARPSSLASLLGLRILLTLSLSVSLVYIVFPCAG